MKARCWAKVSSLNYIVAPSTESTHLMEMKRHCSDIYFTWIAPQRGFPSLWKWSNNTLQWWYNLKPMLVWEENYGWWFDNGFICGLSDGKQRSRSSLGKWAWVIVEILRIRSGTLPRDDWAPTPNGEGGRPKTFPLLLVCHRIQTVMEMRPGLKTELWCPACSATVHPYIWLSNLANRTTAHD